MAVDFRDDIQRIKDENSEEFYAATFGSAFGDIESACRHLKVGLKDVAPALVLYKGRLPDYNRRMGLMAERLSYGRWQYVTLGDLAEHAYAFASCCKRRGSRADSPDWFTYKMDRILATHPAIHKLPYPYSTTGPRLAYLECLWLAFQRIAYVHPGDRPHRRAVLEAMAVYAQRNHHEPGSPAVLLFGWCAMNDTKLRLAETLDNWEQSEERFQRHYAAAQELELADA